MSVGRLSWFVVGALVLVAAGALADGPADLDDRFSADGEEGDAGESPQEAMAIEPGNHQGNLTDEIDERDVFAFDVPAGHALEVRGRTIETGPPFLDPGDRIDMNATLVSPESEEFEIGSSAWYDRRGTDATGTWHLDLELGERLDDLFPPDFAVYTTYNFSVEHIPIPDQNDAGSGQDAGDDMETAVAIGEGNWTAEAGPLDEWDTFSFEASEGRIVHVEVTPAEQLSGRVYFGPSDDGVAWSFRPGETVELGYRVPEDGVHRLAFRFLHPLGTHGYEFNLSYGDFSFPPCHPQDDGGSGGDAPYWPTSEAVELGSGELEGCLDHQDESDAYATELAPGDVVHVSIDPSTCESSESFEVELDAHRLFDEISCQGVEEREIEYIAEKDTRLEARAHDKLEEDNKLNYTLHVQRDTIPLPNPAVLEIDDGAWATIGTPVGEVPLGNLIIDTNPFEPDRKRHVSVTVGNPDPAAGPALEDVSVELHAVPEDCLFDDVPSSLTPGFYGFVERARCTPELVLSGTVADLSVGQNVTFGGMWETTKTFGEQRLVAKLVSTGPDVDRSDNVLVDQTPVVVGTDKGFN